MFPGLICWQRLYFLAVYLQSTCQCLRAAGPEPGRTFHLTEGQYLCERPYKHGAQLGWA